MTLKLPPPPPIASSDPAFNRWCVELLSILSNTGGIDPNSVQGLPEVIAQSAANAADITVLQGEVGGNTLNISTLQGQVAALTAAVATINGQITTLSARGELLFGAGPPAAGLGKVNDWFGDTAGAAGARVWIKKAVGVWTPFPF